MNNYCCRTTTENDAWGSENSQGPKKLRQFKAINSPLTLKKRLIKIICDAKKNQEKTPFINFWGAEKFKSVDINDIYLLFELRENFWNGMHGLPSSKCFFSSKVIHNCLAWRNKSHNKQSWCVSVICNENCFCNR